MSFILDALKKSEAERQQRNTPGIASIPESSKPRSASKWVWIIGVLLAANLSALAYIMLKPDAVDEPAMEQESVSATPNDVPANPVEVPPRPAAARAGQETAAVQSSPPATVESAPADPAPEVTISEPEPQPTVVDGLPSFNELRVQGVLQLPDLHIDIHVYSGTPSERFVFINMSKYSENSTLTEGPRVREITPDGVVLEHRGTAFLLPRE